jgi:hypothetical protein
MNKNELINYIDELQESLFSLPTREEQGYSEKWNEGYRTAVLQVIRDLLVRVEQMEKIGL